MFHPHTAMPVQDTADTGGTSFGADLSDADNAAVSYLRGEVRELQGKAAEIIAVAEQVRRELGAEANSVVDHANREAGFLNAVADDVTARLNAQLCEAKKDPQTGKKKLSKEVIASLTSNVEKIIHGAEQEKKVLVEVATHSEARSPGEKTVVKTVAPTPAPIRVAAGYSAKGAVVGAAAGAASSSNPLHSAVDTVTQVGHSIRQQWQSAVVSAKETWHDITHSDVVKSVRHTARELWTETKAAMKHSGSVIATTAAEIWDGVTHPVATAKAAAVSVRNVAAKAYHASAELVPDGVKQVAKSVYRGAREAYHMARSTMRDSRDWVVGLFKGKDEPVRILVKLPPPKPANDNKPGGDGMAHALKQAAASISLPWVLHGHSVRELLSFSVPDVSKIDLSFSHFLS